MSQPIWCYGLAVRPPLLACYRACMHNIYRILYLLHYTYSTVLVEYFTRIIYAQICRGRLMLFRYISISMLRKRKVKVVNLQKVFILSLMLCSCCVCLAIPVAKLKILIGKFFEKTTSWHFARVFNDISMLIHLHFYSSSCKICKLKTIFTKYIEFIFKRWWWRNTFRNNTNTIKR